MAGKTYYAATKIKFGKRNEDGSQEGKYESVVFNVGDKVTGLSVDDMKGLWNAGALTDQAPATEDNNDAADAGPGEGSAPKPAKAAPAKATSPSA